MLSKFVLQLLVIFIVLTNNYSMGQWARLSDITFNFTTCNSQGINGPTFESCVNHYQSTKSLLAGALIDQPQEQGFEGGQGFNFPRSGVYNVTIAGASGGRGLCNPKTSKGAILRTQLTIEKGVNDSVLVLVGQKGIGPCDSNSNYFLCNSPPTNLTEASQCLSEWMNVSSSVQYQDRLGGGGGGGGSMIWPKNSTGYFNQSVLPLLVAAGGGGTSLQANYTAIIGTFYGINTSTLRLSNETDGEFYQRWINARPTYVDAFNNRNVSNINLIGFVGNRPAVEGLGASVVSGPGAGWFFPGITFAEIDGKPLSRSANFAQGGLDCIVGFGFEETGLPFQSFTGGFGGGGGGCSEGGGGGGFGGGLILTDSPAIPGGGGYSLQTVNGVKVTSEGVGMNEGDGYVEIIPVDCNCTNGCIVNHETLEYQCICHSPTVVAPSGIDCITTTSDKDNIAQESPAISLTVSDVKLSFSFIRFNSLITLYSASISFTVGGRGGNNNGIAKREVDMMEEEEEPNCGIVWLNQDLVPVLLSDSNGTLRMISNTSSGVLSSSRVSSLTVGQTVSSGIVIGNCSIDNFTLSFSTQDEVNNIPANISIQAIISTHNNTFTTILSQVFLPPVIPLPSSTTAITTSITMTSISDSSIYDTSSYSTIFMSTVITVTSTSGPSSSPVLSQNVIIIIASAGGGTLLIGLCVILLIVIIVCAVRRKKSTSLRRVYQVHTKNFNDGEMIGAIVGGKNDQQHPELQKLRYKLASLKVNPNYGEPMIRGSADETDFGEKTVLQNDNATSSMEVSDLEQGYTPLSFKDNKLIEEKGSFDSSAEPRAQPHRIRSRSRRKTFTLRPKYGVMSPTVSFYEYNRQREENDWEHDRTQLTYLREIGEGQFGKVLLMKAKNIAGYKGKLPVAVKTLTSIEDEDVTKFLEEIELMKKFAHPHIVSLLGVSTQSSEGAPLMILEYMPYGDLQSFLAKHKPKHGEHTIIGIYHQVRFAGDIASAMAFLESNKYVHRDVAARNCLVGPNLEVKVADFGMARVVQEKDYYRIAGRAILPVRWMAPESLLYGIFTSASDVWAYGVLLWEIANYGSIPMESYKAQDIVDMAQQNTLYHPWPQDYLEELMQIKDECHHYEAEKRPRFEDIANLLPNSHSS